MGRKNIKTWLTERRDEHENKNLLIKERDVLGRLIQPTTRNLDNLYSRLQTDLPEVVWRRFMICAIDTAVLWKEDFSKNKHSDPLEENKSLEELVVLADVLAEKIVVHERRFGRVERTHIGELLYSAREEFSGHLEITTPTGPQRLKAILELLPAALTNFWEERYWPSFAEIVGGYADKVSFQISNEEDEYGNKYSAGTVSGFVRFFWDEFRSVRANNQELNIPNNFDLTNIELAALSKDLLGQDELINEETIKTARKRAREGANSFKS